MPGISIITNFDVNQSVPIDSRLVATNSTSRNNIVYKYEGLKVYQTDNQLTYTWNGSTWIVEERGGIYGGSGSLIGDTFVDFGTTSNIVGSQSYDLVWKTDADILTKSYLYNNFVRHTIEPTLGFRGTEFRQQFKYFNGSSIVDSAFISFNPVRPDTRPGALAFSTGFGASLKESLRISSDGKIGIGTIDPKEYFQIGTASNSLSLAQPLVIHRGGSSVIGYNWYYTGVENSFSQSHGSSKIIQTKDELQIQNRFAGTSDNNFVTTIFTTATQSGRVGIKTTNPSATLDVNGTINSNNTITGLIVTAGTVSSTNRVTARRYDLNDLTNTYLYTFRDITTNPINSFGIRVGGTTSFYSTGNENTLGKTNVVGDLSVFGDNDLTVYGEGQITNYESSTLLTPNSTVYYSTNSGTFSNTTSLSNFTYSISAYRVGAIVNLSFEIETTSTISYSGTNFLGIMFKLSGERFKPATTSISSGFGGNSTLGNFYPTVTEVFQIDTTGGSATDISSTNDFWVRIRTTNVLYNGSLYVGYPFLVGSNIISGNKFRGTITYKAGTSTPTPVVPANPTVVPGSSS
jgi:hypothetical protein